MFVGVSIWLADKILELNVSEPGTTPKVTMRCSSYLLCLSTWLFRPGHTDKGSHNTVVEQSVSCKVRLLQLIAKVRHQQPSRLT